MELSQRFTYLAAGNSKLITTHPPPKSSTMHVDAVATDAPADHDDPAPLDTAPTAVAVSPTTTSTPTTMAPGPTEPSALTAAKAIGLVDAPAVHQDSTLVLGLNTDSPFLKALASMLRDTVLTAQSEAIEIAVRNALAGFSPAAAAPASPAPALTIARDGAIATMVNAAAKVDDITARLQEMGLVPMGATDIQDELAFPAPLQLVVDRLDAIEARLEATARVSDDGTGAWRSALQSLDVLSGRLEDHLDATAAAAPAGDTTRLEALETKLLERIAGIEEKIGAGVSAGSAPRSLDDSLADKIEALTAKMERLEEAVTSRPAPSNPADSIGPVLQDLAAKLEKLEGSIAAANSLPSARAAPGMPAELLQDLATKLEKLEVNLADDDGAPVSAGGAAADVQAAFEASLVPLVRRIEGLEQAVAGQKERAVGGSFEALGELLKDLAVKLEKMEESVAAERPRSAGLPPVSAADVAGEVKTVLGAALAPLVQRIEGLEVAVAGQRETVAGTRTEALGEMLKELADKLEKMEESVGAEAPRSAGLPSISAADVAGEVKTVLEASLAPLVQRIEGLEATVAGQKDRSVGPATEALGEMLKDLAVKLEKMEESVAEVPRSAGLPPSPTSAEELKSVLETSLAPLVQRIDGLEGVITTGPRGAPPSEELGAMLKNLATKLDKLDEGAAAETGSVVPPPTAAEVASEVRGVFEATLMPKLESMVQDLKTAISNVAAATPAQPTSLEEVDRLTAVVSSRLAAIEESIADLGALTAGQQHQQPRSVVENAALPTAEMLEALEEIRARLATAPVAQTSKPEGGLDARAIADVVARGLEERLATFQRSIDSISTRIEASDDASSTTSAAPAPRQPTRRRLSAVFEASLERTGAAATEAEAGTPSAIALVERLDSLETRLDALPGLFKASLHMALDSHAELLSSLVSMAVESRLAAFDDNMYAAVSPQAKKNAQNPVMMQGGGAPGGRPPSGEQGNGWFSGVSFFGGNNRTSGHGAHH
ncbi:hypothetical protein HDU96_006358 [Phlyctochytrium bullatum]|nr:hypothetical protein HDU96_006358 [Phlyctochytrium bullatum]